MISPIVKTLKNGLKVVFVPCEAESITFGLFIASGSRHEKARYSGISHFIEHMLFKGTPSRTPLQLTREVEGRGGNFNACTSEESTVFYTQLPKEYASDAVDIILDMYQNATIPEDEFERERKVIIEEIKMYRDEPDSVAMENLQASLFAGDPLGAPVAGSEKTLDKLTPKIMREYIRSHYLAESTYAVVVGDFDLCKIERQLENARLRHGKAPSAALKVKQPKNEYIAKMSVNQAQLAVGYRSFGAHDTRRYAVAVFDGIMGRGMSSRLFQAVREKRGLSYDIASRMQNFKDVGMWTVSAGVDAARGIKALEVIDREIMRIKERSVGEAELRRAKEFLVGNFRLSFEKSITKLFFYGQHALVFNALAIYEDEIKRIKGVTSSDIADVARTILRPSNRSISWVLPK